MIWSTRWNSIGCVTKGKDGRQPPPLDAANLPVRHAISVDRRVVRHTRDSRTQQLESRQGKQSRPNQRARRQPLGGAMSDLLQYLPDGWPRRQTTIPE